MVMVNFLTTDHGVNSRVPWSLHGHCMVSAICFMYTVDKKDAVNFRVRTIKSKSNISTITESR